jgi:hypothetical protein
VRNPSQAFFLVSSFDFYLTRVVSLANALCASPLMALLPLTSPHLPSVLLLPSIPTSSIVGALHCCSSTINNPNTKLIVGRCHHADANLLSDAVAALLLSRTAQASPSVMCRRFSLRLTLEHELGQIRHNTEEERRLWWIGPARRGLRPHATDRGVYFSLLELVLFMVSFSLVGG